MTSAALLKKVREAHPDAFEELPRSQLKKIERAIVYASQLALTDGVFSSSQHGELIHKALGKTALNSGDRLKAYRLRQDLSQVELARRTGISQSNLSALEAGKRSMGVQTAKTLALALQCDFRRLL